MSENRSKNNTSSTSSQTSKPISLQSVSGTTIVGNEAPVQITDGGAIKGSIDLAGLTVEKAAQLTLGLVASQADASKAALDASMASQAKAYDFAMNAGRSDVATMQDTTKKILMLAGIIAAAYVLHGWGGK